MNVRTIGGHLTRHNGGTLIDDRHTADDAVEVTPASPALSESIALTGRYAVSAVAAAYIVALAGVWVFLSALGQLAPSDPIVVVTKGTSVSGVAVQNMPAYLQVNDVQEDAEVTYVEVPTSDLPTLLGALGSSEWTVVDGWKGLLTSGGTTGSIPANCPDDLQFVNAASATYAFCTFTTADGVTLTLHVSSDEGSVDITQRKPN